MGYELEATARTLPPAAALMGSLLERWERADARLLEALGHYAAVRRQHGPDAPERIAAELRLAQARHHWRDCALEAGALHGTDADD